METLLSIPRRIGANRVPDISYATSHSMENVLGVFMSSLFELGFGRGFILLWAYSLYSADFSLTVKEMIF